MLRTEAGENKKGLLGGRRGGSGREVRLVGGGKEVNETGLSGHQSGGQAWAAESGVAVASQTLGMQNSISGHFSGERGHGFYQIPIASDSSGREF